MVGACRRPDLHVVFTAFGELQNLGDIFKISEIGLQKGLAGFLPGPDTFSSSGLFFLVGLLPLTSTRPPTPARRTTRRVRVRRLIAARIASSP